MDLVQGLLNPTVKEQPPVPDDQIMRPQFVVRPARPVRGDGLYILPPRAAGERKPANALAEVGFRPIVVRCIRPSVDQIPYGDLVLLIQALEPLHKIAQRSLVARWPGESEVQRLHGKVVVLLAGVRLPET